MNRIPLHTPRRGLTDRLLDAMAARWELVLSHVILFCLGYWFRLFEAMTFGK